MSHRTHSSAYNCVVTDHFGHPRNVAPECIAKTGETDKNHSTGGAVDVLAGEGGTVATGVWIQFQLHIRQQTVERAFFRAFGCPHTVALASWLTERLVGEKLAKDYTLDRVEITALLDLPTAKMRSVLVAEDAIRACAARLEAKV